MQREVIKQGKEAVYIEDHEMLKTIYKKTQNPDYSLHP